MAGAVSVSGGWFRRYLGGFPEMETLPAGRLGGIVRVALVVTLALAAAGCFPSSPNTVIAAKVVDGFIVVVVPSCVRIVERAEVILVDPVDDDRDEMLWVDGSRVEIANPGSDYVEIFLNDDQFPSAEGSYRSVLGAKFNHENDSWVEVRIWPEGAQTFGEVSLYDLPRMTSDSSGGVFNGTAGPLPPEDLGMSEEWLCPSK